MKKWLWLVLLVHFVNCRNTEIQSVDTNLFSPKSPVLATFFHSVFQYRLAADLTKDLVVMSANNKLFIANRAFIWESADGVNYTKYRFSIPNCNPCSIKYIGYSNGNYLMFAFSYSNSFIGIGDSIANINWRDTTSTIPNTYSYYTDFLYSNGKFHYSNGLKIVTTADGGQNFSTFDTGNSYCITLYPVGSFLGCGINAYYDGSNWQAAKSPYDHMNTTSPPANPRGSFVKSRYISWNSNLDQELGTYYFELSTNLTGDIHTNGLSPSSPTYSKLITNSDYIMTPTKVYENSSGLLAFIVTNTSGNIRMITSSDAINWGLKETTLSGWLNSTASFKEYFYVTSNSYSVLGSNTYIYRTTDGTNWEKFDFSFP